MPKLVLPNSMETLHCKAGDHPWQRERKRGKKPVNCPKHSTVQRSEADREAHMLKMQKAREEAAAARRRQIVVDWIAEQEARGCACEVTPDMTLRQINRLETGCVGGWVCPHLDRLRRRLGH